MTYPLLMEWLPVVVILGMAIAAGAVLLVLMALWGIWRTGQALDRIADEHRLLVRTLASDRIAEIDVDEAPSGTASAPAPGRRP